MKLCFRWHANDIQIHSINFSEESLKGCTVATNSVKTGSQVDEIKNRKATTGKRARTTAVLWI